MRLFSILVPGLLLIGGLTVATPTPLLPTPTGTSPGINLTSPTQTSRAEAVAAYVSQLDAAYGTTVGESYQGYANTHPKLTAYAALQAWANTLAASLGPGLANVIKQFANDAGKNTAQIGSGTVKTLAQISNPLNFLAGISQFFGDLTNPQMWFRIGKIALGGVLLLIGLVQITHLDEKITSVAGAAAKVVK